jgi:hypothetical protein
VKFKRDFARSAIYFLVLQINIDLSNWDYLKGLMPRVHPTVSIHTTCNVENLIIVRKFRVIIWTEGNLRLSLFHDQKIYR